MILVIGRGTGIARSVTLAPHNPAGRIGTPSDIAAAVLFAMTNTLLTGMTIKVDGGEPLV